MIQSALWSCAITRGIRLTELGDASRLVAAGLVISYCLIGLVGGLAKKRACKFFSL